MRRVSPLLLVTLSLLERYVNEPQECEQLAEDILQQAGQPFKFRQVAKDRIIEILAAHAECKQQHFCSRCHIKSGKLMPMRDDRNGVWTCIDCGNSWDDDSYPRPDDRGRYTWTRR